MKRRNTELLRDVILRYLREEGLETPLNEHRAVLAWPRVVGPVVSRLTGDVSFRQGTLYVKILRPALRQNLMMERTQLARKINAEVGAQVVENVVIY
jgi:predicted nucleic acid-binding Zn ribbon protein